MQNGFSPDLKTAKARLREYMRTAEVSEFEWLIQRFQRSTAGSTRVEKVKPMKYMSHKEFVPRINAKIKEFASMYGTGVFTRAGSLKDGQVLDEYLAWYLNERRDEIALHTKEFGQDYYVKQARDLARKARQEQMKQDALRLAELEKTVQRR